MPARAPLWAPPPPASEDPLVPPPLGCPWRLPGKRRLPYLSVMLTGVLYGRDVGIS